MRPLESMLLRMEPLGLYDLTKDGSLVLAEVSACAEVLEIAYDGLLELEREAYFVSATDWGFSGKCSLLGIADGGEWRRQAGLQLLRTRQGRCTRVDYAELAGCFTSVFHSDKCFSAQTSRHRTAALPKGF